MQHFTGRGEGGDPCGRGKDHSTHILLSKASLSFSLTQLSKTKCCCKFIHLCRLKSNMISSAVREGDRFFIGVYNAISYWLGDNQLQEKNQHEVSLILIHKPC